MYVDGHRARMPSPGGAANKQMRRTRDFVAVPHLDANAVQASRTFSDHCTILINHVLINYIFESSINPVANNSVIHTGFIQLNSE